MITEKFIIIHILEMGHSMRLILTNTDSFNAFYLISKHIVVYYIAS